MHRTTSHLICLTALLSPPCVFAEPPASIPLQTSCPGVVIQSASETNPTGESQLRAGDLIRSWETVEERPTRGVICWPVDWFELKTEQATRTPVRLIGERQGHAFAEIPSMDGWNVEIRPYLSNESRENRTQGRIDSISLLGPAIDRALVAGNRDIAIWLLQTISRANAQRKDWETALSAADMAIEISERCIDPRMLTMSHIMKGEIFEKEGKWGSAREEYQKARLILEVASRESFSLALVNYRLGTADSQQGLFADADSAFQRALEIHRRKAPRTLALAQSLHGLALAKEKLGDLQTAYDLNLQALALREELAPNSQLVAKSLMNLGEIAIQRGNLAHATELMNRGLIIFSQEPGNSNHAKALVSLGSIEIRLGNIRAADGLYRQAKQILEALDPQHPDLPRVMDSLGVVAYRREDVPSARAFFETSLHMKERLGAPPLEIASSLNHLGAALMGKDLNAAEDYYRHALAILEKEAPENLQMAVCLTGLGHIAGLRHDLKSAEWHHRQSLALKRRIGPDSLEVASSLYNLGFTLFAQAKGEEARRLFAEAAEIRSRLSPGSSAEAEALLMVADTDRNLGRGETALQLMDRALRIFEGQESRLGGSQEAKAAFHSASHDGYRDYIETLLELGHEEEAFNVLERARAQVYREMLTQRERLGLQTPPPELTTELARLHGEHDRIYEQLRGLDGRPETKPEADSLLGQLRMLREEQSSLQEHIRDATKPPEIDYLQPKRLQSIKELLEQGTLLLSYNVGANETQLFITGRETALRVAQIAIGEKDLKARVALFRKLIADGPAAPHRSEATNELATSLFKLLIEPVRKEVSVADRLLIVADGPLHSLPFSALCRKDSAEARGCQYLAEWKPLHFDLSATVNTETVSSRGRWPQDSTLSAFGDPEYSEMPTRDQTLATRGLSLARLPYSRREVEEIASLFGGHAKVFLGENATEENAKAIRTDTRYVHFACHAVLDGDLPLDSGLILSRQACSERKNDNGILQAWEIFDQIRLRADLVTLSACESALGKELSGEGLMGLTRAFEYAGARSVLASLWKISDRTTAELMVRFYKHLKSGMPKDEALREAQMELIHGPIQIKNEKGEEETIDASAPYYWAAFQIYGDWQ